MKATQKTGIALILGALGVLVPYTLLTLNFGYPDVLRLPSGEILKSFYEGRNGLIYTWLGFALGGLPLFYAYSGIKDRLSVAGVQSQLLTFFGLSSLVFQMIGLLRWVFIVPILAASYADAQTEAELKSVEVAFKLIHQFGGVLMGEHIGQLFTVIWTFGIAYKLAQAGIIRKYLAYCAYIIAVIYFLAQAELLQTVIPTFPVWDLAGFIGSTLWLIWLIVIGVIFIKEKNRLAINIGEAVFS